MIIILIVLILFIFKAKNKLKSKNNIFYKKTILITGFSSSKGLKFIESLKSGIYNVIIIERNKKKLAKTVEYLNKLNINAIGYSSNLSKLNQVNNLFNKIIKKFGKIDILINNMYNLEELINIQDLSDKNILDYININLSNIIILTKLVLNNQIKNNINGKIIYIINGASDINENSNNLTVYSDLYIIIKNSIEKITKILSKNNYKNKISISCIRIDESSITKEQFFNNLKDLDELNKLFIYILNTNWKNTTGRIFNPKEFGKSINLSSLELNININLNENLVNMYNQLSNRSKQKFYLNLGENYIGMSPKINTFLKSKNFNFSEYSHDNIDILNILANKYSVKNDNIIMNNGTMMTIKLILNNFIKPYHEIITTNPAWILFDNIAHVNNLELIISQLNFNKNKLEINFDDITSKISSLTRIIYLVTPIDSIRFEKFIKFIPKNILIIIDFCYEEFYDYSNKIDISKFINSHNIIGLYSFSKFYALADLQLGYIIANDDIIKLFKICNFIPIPNYKEEVAKIALNDTEHNLKIKKYYITQKEYIISRLKENNLQYLDSFQNHIYVKYNKINYLKKELFKNNILYDYTSLIDNYIIMIIGSPENNKIFLDILSSS